MNKRHITITPARQPTTAPEKKPNHAGVTIIDLQPTALDLDIGKKWLALGFHNPTYPPAPSPTQKGSTR